jgi:hypothetical protein
LKIDISRPNDAGEKAKGAATDVVKQAKSKLVFFPTGSCGLIVTWRVTRIGSTILNLLRSTSERMGKFLAGGAPSVRHTTDVKPVDRYDR